MVESERSDHLIMLFKPSESFRILQWLNMVVIIARLHAVESGERHAATKSLPSPVAACGQPLRISECYAKTYITHQLLPKRRSPSNFFFLDVAFSGSRCPAAAPIFDIAGCLGLSSSPTLLSIEIFHIASLVSREL